MFRRFRRGGEVVGFALSGGGSRGASQVGALKALAEAGIRPQIVAGTSAGAVNAAWIALYPHRLDRLEAIWLALRRRDVFPGTAVHMLVNMVRQGYVHRADLWENFLRQQVGNATFEQATIPCHVTAVRLRDGERVLFNSGEIVPALMASTAIPGVFPPFRIEDEQYVDGGVLEYMPIPTLIEQGATAIWALDCSSFSTEIGVDVATVDRCARISARAAVRRETSLQATRGRTIHLLQPDLPEYPDARDFGHTVEVIAAGYDDARAYLRHHPSLLEHTDEMRTEPDAG